MILEGSAALGLIETHILARRINVHRIKGTNRVRALALLVISAGACSSPSGPGSDGGISGQARELLGIWVSDDDPAERLVFEFLTHDPYSDLLAGQTQVYRLWQYPPAAEPALTQLGKYDVIEGELRTSPGWASLSGVAGKTYANKILSRAGDQLVLDSTKLASGKRTLGRVAAFPGGGFGGGVAAPADPVEPVTRAPLGEKPSTNSVANRGQLFRTGAAEAVAVRALTFKPTAEEQTELESYRTPNSGGSWNAVAGETSPSSYHASRAQLKEQAHGLPLIYPLNSLSEYLYLWNPELGAWERDNDVQICREEAGFPDRDIVLRSAKGISYSACIADGTIAVHRRVLGLNSNRIASIPGSFDRVGAQWLKGSTEHGTLYVLGLIRGAAKPFTLYTYVETHEKEFAGFGAPAAEIAADCGGAPCQVKDLSRYFITGDGVHHVVALAEDDRLPKKAHPLAPESRLAIHLHGTLGGSWKTEVLNLRDGAFLGNLIDVDFPQAHPGAPDKLYATLQDDACLRVLSSPAASIAWKPLGVVPTLHRPLDESALVWSDDRIGLLTRGAKLEYLALPILPDAARCPAPRKTP
jgi:hypothetical protein